MIRYGLQLLKGRLRVVRRQVWAWDCHSRYRYSGVLLVLARARHPAFRVLGCCTAAMSLATTLLLSCVRSAVQQSWYNSGRNPAVRTCIGKITAKRLARRSFWSSARSAVASELIFAKTWPQVFRHSGMVCAAGTCSLFTRTWTQLNWEGGFLHLFCKRWHFNFTDCVVAKAWACCWPARAARPLASKERL